MGTIFVAATQTVKSRARTGIQTVGHGLLRGLSQSGADFDVVTWKKWRRIFSPAGEPDRIRLGLGGQDKRAGATGMHQAWLLLPELSYRSKLRHAIRFARRRQMRIAAIFFDAIPISHPQLVRREAVKYHADYMRALCDVDLLFATSNAAAGDFRAFAQENGLRLPRILVRSLPGEVTGQERLTSKPPNFSGTINILCVSTLERRKNHTTLLKAFQLASAAITRPELRLHLVGDRYKDAESVVKEVENAVARNRNVIWHGTVTAAQLSDFYRQCDFTIYPSFLEGFGLPIVESLWQRRPCICADFGAMAETAHGGGCLSVDIRDPAKLAEAIVTLSTRPEVRQKLIGEIESRPMKTWAGYAGEIQEALAANQR